MKAYIEYVRNECGRFFEAEPRDVVELMREMAQLRNSWGAPGAS